MSNTQDNIKLPYLNHVVVSGKIATDPKLDQTKSGNSVCKLRICNTRHIKGKDPENTFFDAICWNEQANYVYNNMIKGTKVVITGRIRMDEWVDKTSGQKRNKLYIQCDRISNLKFKEDAQYQDDVEADYAGTVVDTSDLDE